MKGVDIRIPIGLLFTILGIVLLVFGFVSDSSLYQRSLGININLWWGFVLALSGVATLVLSRKRPASSNADNGAADPGIAKSSEPKDHAANHLSKPGL